MEAMNDMDQQTFFSLLFAKGNLEEREKEIKDASRRLKVLETGEETNEEDDNKNVHSTQESVLQVNGNKKGENEDTNRSNRNIEQNVQDPQNEAGKNQTDQETVIGDGNHGNSKDHFNQTESLQTLHEEL